jgi:carbonic anhydrase
MEMHFVHLSNDTTPHLAAVAVFIEEGPPSPFLEQYFHLFDYVSIHVSALITHTNAPFSPRPFPRVVIRTS